MNKRALDEILQDCELLLVAGAGGVGKTTLSAAIALQAALLGRRVAVLTIDPARRLGSALGFRNLGNRLRIVSPKRLDSMRVQLGGTLGAAMLDVKGTFDEMVTRYAPNKKTCEAILANPLYAELSEALSGTHEYMALERIHQFYESKEFDLLILDTPPASALSDFLAAPERLRSFLDRNIVRWFLPSKRNRLAGLAAKAVGRGIRWALALLDKLAGGSILEDLAGLLADFEGLFEGLHERVTTVQKLLKSKKTRFVLVTTSDSVPFSVAATMAQELARQHLQLGAVVMNRTLSNNKPKCTNDFERELWTALEPLVERQTLRMHEIKRRFRDVTVFEVPLISRDPSTLPDLARIEFTLTDL